ncbi:MAG: hypothetical protein PHE56_08020 [Bacteroidales bacterium]|nr:hypothetical protein [Bacteroidales bacterium]
MSTNLTGTDLIQHYADTRGLEYSLTESDYPRSAQQPIAYHKRKVIIRNQKFPDLEMAMFADSQGLTEFSQYAGIFFNCNYSSDVKITVRNKDFLDRLAGRNSGKPSIFGDHETSSKVVVENKSDAFDIIKSEFAKTAALLPEIFKINQLLKVGINDISPDFVPELQSKSIAGIYILNQWIFDFEQLDRLWEIAGELKEALG